MFAGATLCLARVQIHHDDANDFAPEHWTANVADGQQLFWDAVKKLTSGLDLRS